MHIYTSCIYIYTDTTHTHTYIHICTCICTYLYACMIMYTKGIYIRIRENTNIHISYTCMKSHFVSIFARRAPHTSAPLMVTRGVLIDHRQLHLAVGLIKTHRFVVRSAFEAVDRRGGSLISNRQLYSTIIFHLIKDPMGHPVSHSKQDSKPRT